MVTITGLAKRRFLATLVAVLAIVGLSAVTAVAGGSTGASWVPSGPRLAMVVWPANKGGQEIVTIGPTGEDPQTLLVSAGGSVERNIDRPIWSPDGAHLVFLGSGGKLVRGIYVMGAEGSGLRRLPNSESPGGKNTVLVSEPVFDPAGDSLTVDIMNRHSWHSLWSMPVDGSKGHRLSAWVEDRYLYPYSAAPDGTLAAQSRGSTHFAIGTIDPDGSSLHVLLRNNGEGFFDPAISPDGTEIAYVRNHFRSRRNPRPTLVSTDLMLMPIGGGRSKRLATIPGGALWPSWDPSGSRLAFTDINEKHRALMEVNADGTCLSTIYKPEAGAAVLGAAWEPGEGRGAGPISC
jgi:Tol biopolymer transport system component